MVEVVDVDPGQDINYWTRIHLVPVNSDLPATDKGSPETERLDQPGEIDLVPLLREGPACVDLDIVGRPVPPVMSQEIARTLEDPLHNARTTRGMSELAATLGRIQSTLDRGRDTAVLEPVVVVGAANPQDLAAAAELVRRRVLPTTDAIRWEPEYTPGGTIRAYTNKLEALQLDEIDPTALQTAPDFGHMIVWPSEPFPNYGVSERVTYAVETPEPAGTEFVHRPGSQIIGIRLDNNDPPRPVGPLYQPAAVSRRNTLMLAAPGTGKTTYIHWRIGQQTVGDYHDMERARLTGEPYIPPINFILDARKDNHTTDLAAKLDGITVDAEGTKLPETMRKVIDINLGDDGADVTVRGMLSLIRRVPGISMAQQREIFGFAIAAGITDPIGQDVAQKYAMMVYDELMQLSGYNLATGRPRFGTEEPIQPDIQEMEGVTDKVVQKLYAGSSEAIGSVSGYTKSSIAKKLHGIPAMLFGEGNEIMWEEFVKSYVDALERGESPPPLPKISVHFGNPKMDIGDKRTALFTAYTSMLAVCNLITKGKDVDYTLLRATWDEAAGLLQKGTPVGEFIGSLSEITRGAGVEVFVAQQGGATDLVPAAFESGGTFMAGAQPYGPNRAVIRDAMPGITHSQLERLGAMPRGTMLISSEGYKDPVRITFPRDQARGRAHMASLEPYLDKGFNPELYHPHVFSEARDHLLNPDSSHALAVWALAWSNAVLIDGGRAPAIIDLKADSELLQMLRDAKEIARTDLRPQIRDRAVVKAIESMSRGIPEEGRDISLRRLTWYSTQNLLRQMDPSAHGAADRFRFPRLDLTRGTSYLASVLDQVNDRLIPGRLNVLKPYVPFLGEIPGTDAEEQLENLQDKRNAAIALLINTINQATIRSSGRAGTDTPILTPVEMVATTSAFAQLTGAPVSSASIRQVQMMLQERHGQTVENPHERTLLAQMANYIVSQGRQYDQYPKIASFGEVIAMAQKEIDRLEAAVPNIGLEVLGDWQKLYGLDFLSGTSSSALEQKDRILKLQAEHNQKLPHPPRSLQSVFFARNPMTGDPLIEEIGERALRLRRQRGGPYDELYNRQHGGKDPDLTYLGMLETNDDRAAEWAKAVADLILYNPGIAMPPGSRRYLRRHLMHHIHLLGQQAKGVDVPLTPEPEI